MSIFARLTVAEYGRMLIAGVFDQGRRVEFIDVIPKSTSGKILRKDLRAREQA